MITPVFRNYWYVCVTIWRAYGLVVKRPITPPCHGGDRRFESGRARQIDPQTKDASLASSIDISTIIVYKLAQICLGTSSEVKLG
jgi:hypothetical protein